jgi:hypothetical protein
MVCFEADELINACDENAQLGYVVMRRIANVIASRLLTNRLELFDIIVHQPSKILPTTQE